MNNKQIEVRDRMLSLKKFITKKMPLIKEVSDKFKEETDFIRDNWVHYGISSIYINGMVKEMQESLDGIDRNIKGYSERCNLTNAMERFAEHSETPKDVEILREYFKK